MLTKTNKHKECLAINFNSQLDLSALSRFKFNLKSRLQESARILYSENKHPAKVFIIGSGNRVRKNFLPALCCLKHPIVVSGIYSRTFKHAKEVAEQWDMEAYELLDNKALEEADIIIVSITALSVPEVLKNIQKMTDTSNKVLIVDTPVFAGLKTVLNSYLLRQFANVIVTEDYMNFPQFKYVRDVIEKGGLGRVKKIHISHLGYRYHGLALARSFINFPLIHSVKHPHSGFLYQTDNDCEILVQEPYRSLNGYLHIIGEKGDLLFCPKSCSDSLDVITKTKADYLLTEQEGSSSGFKLVSPEGTQYFPLKLFQKIQSLPLYAEDNFNTFKTIGLVEVINSAFSYNINSRYGFINGLYDNYVTNLSYARRTFGLSVLKIPYYAVKVLSLLH